MPGLSACATSQATAARPVTQDGKGNSVVTLDLGAIDVITWSNGTVNCGAACTNALPGDGAGRCRP